ETIKAAAVILATGGLSVPNTGSDGTGLRIAAQLGHRLNPTFPALTPLVAEPAPHAYLSGVSLKVRLSASGEGKGTSVVGGFLFTPRGYSGPAVLDLSHRAVLSRMRDGPRAALQVNWCDLSEEDWERLLASVRGRVEVLLRSYLPDRLAGALLEEAG